MGFVEYFRVFFSTARLRSTTEPPVHLLCMLHGRQGFCTLANLFTGRRKIVKDFLTAPSFIFSSQGLLMLHCLLSHCCRQFLFVGRLVL